MAATLTNTKRRQSVITEAKQLKDAGYTQTEIAKILKVSTETLRGYLKEIDDQTNLLKTFKQSIGDALHLDLLLGLQLKHKVLISLDDGDVASMSASDKRQFIRDLSVNNGTTFDKIRLHEGKSTTNSSHHLQVNLAHQHLFPSPTSSGSVGKEVEHTKGKDCGIMSHSTDNDTQAIDNTEITG